MDDDTRRFVTGMFFGCIAGVIAWAALLYMVASIVDRI